MGYDLTNDDTEDIISLVKEFGEKSRGKIDILNIDVEEWAESRSSQFIFNYFPTVDAIHLYTAELVGVKYFITRDGDFLKNKKLILEITKIDVLHPQEVEI